MGLIKTILQPKTTLLLCVTIGLLPYNPTPHIWGKLLWIAGGAKGMQLIDWLDVVFHGLPWVMLPISLTVYLKNKIKKVE